MGTGQYDPPLYPGWTAFWKVIYGNDPAIVHVWVTNAPHPVHDPNTNTNEDFDALRNVEGGSTVIYLHWGEDEHRNSPNGRNIQASEFHAVINAAIQGVIG